MKEFIGPFVFENLGWVGVLQAVDYRRNDGDAGKGMGLKQMQIIINKFEEWKEN